MVQLFLSGKDVSDRSMHCVHGWQSASGWSPVYVDDNLGVMSIGFMLPNADDAIIWRGPRKNGGLGRASDLLPPHSSHIAWRTCFVTVVALQV